MTHGARVVRRIRHAAPRLPRMWRIHSRKFEPFSEKIDVCGMKNLRHLGLWRLQTGPQLGLKASWESHGLARKLLTAHNGTSLLSKREGNQTSLETTRLRVERAEMKR